MDKPLVSIVTITYNHAPYIKRALDGILSQKTTFPFELVLSDDCSTDGTAEICREYSKKCPEIVRLITDVHNVGGTANERRAVMATQGKYIAFCEGDDYWTDPYKLQKQVDFLEAHPDYSVTFHRYRKYIASSDSFLSDDLDDLFANVKTDGVEITTEMFLSKWMTQFLTMVYRKEAFELDIALKYKYYRDSHLTYHLLQSGKGFLFAFVGGVYNITGSGIYSSLDQFQLNKKWVAVNEELWRLNDDERLKAPYIKSIQFLIDSFVKKREIKKYVLCYIIRHFQVSRDFKRLIKNIINWLK